MPQYLVTPDEPDIWFTMGPESNHPFRVQDLIEEGATGVRLTFSFGTQELQSQRAELVSRAAEAASAEATIIADLEGEEMRLADFPGYEKLPVQSEAKVRLMFDKDEFEPDSNSIPVGSDKFESRVEDGDRIVVGDGSVILDVVQVHSDHASCEVVDAGVINPNRGIVIQESQFEPTSLTEKDVADIEYVAGRDEFDAVALSFVSTADEVRQAKDILASAGGELPIVSKVETPQGVENIDEIAAASDAIMVARGDLALFFPWNELGVHTKRIVSGAEAAETPWIMATQMAEGLERFAFPTRAEICDLTRWVDRGMDGMLLSYETAFGASPVKAVSCMREVVNRIDD
jgi:pyruvate kinase